MNGDPLPDTGGLMPFVQGREVHTDGQASGTVLADITPGVIGDNEVVIKFRVRADGETFGNICNQGYVDYEANLLPAPIPTNDPGTGAIGDATCVTQTTGYRVSGSVFEDLNVDGLKSSSEPGIARVAVVLYNQITGQCRSVLTDANGFYEFTSVSSGPKTITERSSALVPVPAVCPPPAPGQDPTDFLSSTVNQRSIYVINTNITDVNFGDVRKPALTPNLEGVLTPGTIQTYSHLFEAPTDGEVTFGAISTPSPALQGWTSTIYEDVDCSGDLNSGDLILTGSTSLTAGDSICLINRVFAPSTASAGDTMLSDLQATYNYAGSLVSDQSVFANDFTTVLETGESALVLTKRVRNITPTSDAFDSESVIQNAANPGDRLRYEISFANTGVGNITDINIYDAVPAFTELAEELDVSCQYIDPLTSNALAEIPPSLTCSLITPSSVSPDDNEPGYSGTLHWQLLGTMRPGQAGLIVFTVDVK